MFGLGTQEILLIFGVVVLLFGAKRIPEVARSIGKSLHAFKSGLKESNEEVSEVKKEVDATLKS